MAKKLVGRKGRELAESVVTAEGGRVLPKIRTTRKQELASQTLISTIGVAFVHEQPKDMYRLLRYFRFKWNGQGWVVNYPAWIEVVESSHIDWVKVRN